MKKYQVLLAAIAFSSLNSIAFAGANECVNDMNEMKVQISQYGSISSADHQYRFDAIEDAKSTGKSSCNAKAYRGGRLICTIGWQKENWGNTFTCM